MKPSLLWVAAFGAVLILLPQVIGSAYYVNLCSQILIAAILASSLNILVGFGGLTSLGHAAYAGTAAYFTVYLSAHAGFGYLAGAVMAVAGTTAMALLFGLLALRASGLGFLMITLALGQILWGIAYRWVSLTGGDNGLGGFTRPQPFGIDLADPAAFYYFALVVFGLALFAIHRFMHSPFGQSLQGTRDQPRRMSALGYNVRSIQLLSFVYAGFWGAVAGLLYAYYHQFVSPHVLHLTTSAETLLMVIAGGAGTLFGPVVGAALVVILKNVASAYIARWMMLLGAVFVAIVLFMPDGLVPGVSRLFRRFRNTRRTAMKNTEPDAAALPPTLGKRSA
ncbi:branched-chain amino acid transport system permease protein [Skermanella aerolata]|uniref:Branched-chain amino acid ABC transporter permease n=1 Tax=Skermanella aerolata TaxID=393310 RepID=A0A512DN44_9PROT|nr:branched-chain amino acid ABC transporter permease [Skermanella aerolata]KJB94311.1 ABC transporter permease [Skermanella aerolata KACC 11604]GEO37904.1 branched-chain amino acid ABC transporter permease [Skermanella aerolata]